MFSGAIASNPSSGLGHRVGEYGLGHPGAGRRRDRVDGDAVAADLGGRTSVMPTMPALAAE